MVPINSLQTLTAKTHAGNIEVNHKDSRVKDNLTGKQLEGKGVQ